MAKNGLRQLFRSFGIGVDPEAMPTGKDQFELLRPALAAVHERLEIILNAHAAAPERYD